MDKKKQIKNRYKIDYILYKGAGKKLVSLFKIVIN